MNVTVTDPGGPRRTDRQSRHRCTRCSEVDPTFTERAAASQQVAPRDPLSYRRMSPVRAFFRHKADRSTDSHVPTLARVHHLRPRKLDINILPTDGPNGVDPGAVQGGSSAT